MGLLRFGSPLRDMYEEEPPEYHKKLIEALTESPKPLGKRARRRLRGRLKQEKRNGKA